MVEKPLVTNARIKQLLKECAKNKFKDKFNEKEWTFGTTQYADGDEIIRYFHTEDNGKIRHYFYYQFSNKYIWYKIFKNSPLILIKSKRCIRIIK